MSVKNKKRRNSRFTPLLSALVAVITFIGLALGLLDGTTTGKPASGPSLSPMGAADETGYSVTFLDVGQGDATLLSLGGEFILIDASTASASDTVVSALKARGVTRLRAAVASHPHEDHIGGLPAVLEAFPTEMLYMPDATANTACFARLLDTIEQTDTAVSVPEPGDLLEVSGTTLTFLWPPSGTSYDGLNNTSLIVLADTGAERMLFVGDAETQELDALVDTGADLSCDIYKVGHHGSHNSSSAALLDAATPSTAVISCGQGNSYGHPHKEALDRLQGIGAQVYITAEDGDVAFPLTPPPGTS